MSTLGILLFTSPVQHRASDTAAGIAAAAIDLGHEVEIFCLGDGVYNASRRLLLPGERSAVAAFADLGARLRLVNCSTCARFRGVDDASLLPNARNGTLEDLSELLRRADRFLTFSAEA